MTMHRLGRVEKDPVDTSSRAMKPLDWAREGESARQRYFEAQPSPDMLAKVDAYQVTPTEYLESPHLRVRALENELGHMFRTMMGAIERELDEASACKVAYSAGLAHGQRRLGTFMEGQKLSGGAKTMAMWQDTGHASAGAKHASALYARYDDTLVEVARTENSFGAHTGDDPPAMKAFFDGFVNGYKAADPLLVRVEEMERPRADGKIELVHRFWYTSDQ